MTFLSLSLSFQVVVPRFAVGIIIGRNGDMIKKIQNDAGVRIQFKQGTKIKTRPNVVNIIKSSNV